MEIILTIQTKRPPDDVFKFRIVQTIPIAWYLLTVTEKCCPTSPGRNDHGRHQANASEGCARKPACEHSSKRYYAADPFLPRHGPPKSDRGGMEQSRNHNAATGRLTNGCC